MQNIKFHAVTAISVLFFSFIAAITVNGIIRYSLEVLPTEKNRIKMPKQITINDKDINIDQLLETGFFRIISASSDENNNLAASALEDLKLIGTVTGPTEIARALILKKGERAPVVYKLSMDVHGFKISEIGSSKVTLKRNGEKHLLNLFEKKEFSSSKQKPTGEESPGSGTVKKNISRAEMQQKVMNNIDNAMNGIQAGPYRVNGQIEGFKMIRIRPYNILYEYGIRSGDIIKRINGKKVDSTEKLFNMWQGMKNESKMVLDVERNSQIMTFELNITD